ncbi:MAG: 3-deoxy-manno-octulosonate cytidylyltransferase [Phycisphaerae bacterium]|nr:3-deoxy-manno-octulosonate cytidylyltransferase [Phycisphaerae bacterium]
MAIIPARLGSTRLPGKVLLDRTGKTLIQHVYETAQRASCLSRIIVATDDPRVADTVRAFGGECVLTSPSHPNGTARLAEACRVLALPESPGDQIIVNLQGDEPEMPPALIEAAVDALRRSPPTVETATVAVPFAPGDDPVNPNLVKVVRRPDGTAMYFSRAPIPFDRDGEARADAKPLRHLGLYVYRRRFLARYATLRETPLERTEKLEQLRVLEHGLSMAVAVFEPDGPLGAGIDTPEQYEAFVARMKRRAENRPNSMD